MAQQPRFLKSVNPWITGTAVIAALSLGALYFGISQAQNHSPAPAPSASIAPATAVTRRGGDYAAISEVPGFHNPLVTHDNRILDIADRIVHIEDGRLVRDQSVKFS